MLFCESAFRIISAFFYLSAGIAAAQKGKGNCPKLKLENGKTKYRANNRIAKYACQRGYFLVGDDYSTCVMGQWSTPPPFCATTGCHKLNAPDNGRIIPKYSGAVIYTECNPGYKLTGEAMVFCDGLDWNGTIARCQANAGEEMPAKTCDFERDDLCGWTQDPSHDFDWQRQNLATSSSHVGTGPSYDHTLGPGRDGYYLYIEASSPRKENDSARLFSPVYGPSDSVDACFTFWYHMYGATTGQLRVYVKPESLKFSALKPVFQQAGEKGNRWFQGLIPISPLQENFQIIIEGIRGSSYVSDTAIDDVGIQYGDQCNPAQPTIPTPDNTSSPIQNTVLNANESCQLRCGISLSAETPPTPASSEICSCEASCLLQANCCVDYLEFCQEHGPSSSTSSSTSLDVGQPVEEEESTSQSNSSRNSEPVTKTTSAESSESTEPSTSWSTSLAYSPSWSSTSAEMPSTSLSLPVTSTSNNFIEPPSPAPLTSLIMSTLPTALSSSNSRAINATGSAINPTETVWTVPFSSPEASAVTFSSLWPSSSSSSLPSSTRTVLVPRENTTGSSISSPTSPGTSKFSSTTTSLPHFSSSTVSSNSLTSSAVPDRVITAGTSSSRSSTLRTSTARLSPATPMTTPSRSPRPTTTATTTRAFRFSTRRGSASPSLPSQPPGHVTSRYPSTPTSAPSEPTTRAWSHATPPSRTPETNKVNSPQGRGPISGIPAGQASQELQRKDLNDDPAGTLGSASEGQDSNTSLMVALFGSGAAMLVIIAVVLSLVVRRNQRVQRSSASQQHRLAEDSDVRFLHAEDDVQLDLREAKPQFENFEEL